jgi:hypothetical protein
MSRFPLLRRGHQGGVRPISEIHANFSAAIMGRHRPAIKRPGQLPKAGCADGSPQDHLELFCGFGAASSSTMTPKSWDLALRSEIVKPSAAKPRFRSSRIAEARLGIWRRNRHSSTACNSSSVSMICSLSDRFNPAICGSPFLLRLHPGTTHSQLRTTWTSNLPFPSYTRFAQNAERLPKVPLASSAHAPHIAQCTDFARKCCFSTPATGHNVTR